MTAIVILLAMLAVLLPTLSMQRRGLAGKPQSQSTRAVLLGAMIALAVLGLVLIYLLVTRR
ncbi:hypothetical protein G7078_10640 [Sphingomonas sinipercae]|uniref:Uncharacterized protein n=1 Tax=Sphingomonas sinipercae TaxID=2714944 RepID=A0A6G7ZQK9_9SPHN|nr:hypothetical protein [Sphingomonas sinipercae]QIL03190.1 hypothetical protein G7078_10640 [Sphingomonas sinipercae]